MGKTQGNLGTAGRSRVNAAYEKGKAVAEGLGIDLSKWSPEQMLTDLPKLANVNLQTPTSPKETPAQSSAELPANVRGRPLSELL